MELAKKMLKRDPATAPTVGDRVPYVIVKVFQLFFNLFSFVIQAAQQINKAAHPFARHMHSHVP